VLIFQEQVLRIAREIAGLSWVEADSLRKGMSKFQSAEMEAMRDRFVVGCQRAAPDGPALSEPQARALWEQVAPFAGYGFNQGHATAYADVSYRSAYVRAHWPTAFLAARLANWVASTTRRSTLPRRGGWALACAHRISTSATASSRWCQQPKVQVLCSTWD
jgi:DNA polymerase III alpha subunit